MLLCTMLNNSKEGELKNVERIKENIKASQYTKKGKGHHAFKFSGSFFFGSFVEGALVAIIPKRI